ncbi:hypothetical protein PAT3040_06149 [Paenibacillus agaridevorans]|uniref:Uncharacterized protein n=1 Tax=Paenibacillus agaridevorans TaxID=171404 RepID=A0A2R5F1J5_9BACL|nr:hypothetical protein [Paenibacillus agaridevorans]GBG11348.1 hypothetical protein PAT3040_06149 [Paenibacillus agaridevorans]
MEIGKLHVLYERDGDSGHQLPVWVMLTEMRGTDWGQTLYIRLDAPFEAYASDVLDADTLAVAVPDHVYVRHKDDPDVIGIHMPSLRTYVERYTALAEYPVHYTEMDRLLLRISDIEDMLQYDVRVLLPWNEI